MLSFKIKINGKFLNGFLETDIKNVSVQGFHSYQQSTILKPILHDTEYKKIDCLINLKSDMNRIYDYIGEINEIHKIEIERID